MRTLDPSLTFLNLSAHDLPGPDTETKRLALDSHDPRLQQMLAEAIRVGWPAAYSDDLYLHDRQQLAKHPGETMLWILRDHGTHLYPTECDNIHEARYYRQVVDYWSGGHQLNVAFHAEDRARYYLVTPTRLTPLTCEEARDALTVRPTTARLEAPSPRPS